MGVDLLISHPFAVLPLPLLRAGDPLLHFTDIYRTGSTPDTEDEAVDFFLIHASMELTFYLGQTKRQISSLSIRPDGGVMETK